jgi:hypothetical protein
VEPIAPHNPYQSPQAQSAEHGPPARTHDARIVAIAQGQKWIRLAFVAVLAGIVRAAVAAITGVERLSGPAGGVTAASGLCAMVGVATVAQQSLRSKFVALILSVLAVFPLVNLIVLVMLDRHATRLLRDEGIRVTLMGADSRDLR